jgi:hypothetical protein
MTELQDMPALGIWPAVGHWQWENWYQEVYGAVFISNYTKINMNQ